MPTYAYKCSNCDHSFERITKIADRKSPCEEKCEKCDQENTIEHVLTPVEFNPDVPPKVHSGFKEVVSKIKKAHPKNTIPDY